MTRLWLAIGLLGGALWAVSSAAEAQAPDEEPTPDGEAVPWDGATDVTLPPFLQDTEKRVVDERPPPTEAQLDRGTALTEGDFFWLDGVSVSEEAYAYASQEAHRV